MRWIPVGRVVSIFGLRGEVKFYYYNEVKEGFQFTSLFAVKGSEHIELKIERAQYRKKFFYLSFQGITTTEEASFLVTKELFVREEDLPALDEGEYYEYQLIGLDVITADGTSIGKVGSLLHTGANDILVITGERELLVPMVEDFIVNIDIQGGKITVNIEGLLV